MSVALAWMCTLTYLCMCVYSTFMHGPVHLLLTILMKVLVLVLAYMHVNYVYLQCAHSILSYLTLGCPGSHFVMNHAFMLNSAFSSSIMEFFFN